MRRRSVCAVAVLLLSACGGSHRGASSIEHPAASTPRVGGVAIRSKPAAPAVALHDAEARPVRLSQFRGRWVVVAFLYTHCPDVCPLIAHNLNVALARAPDLRVVAVSVDPKGDTPAAVRAYARNRGLRPAFHYLIGTRAQLQPVWRAWHVATVPGPSATVSHTSFEVLVDPQGRERVFYDAQVRPADVLQDLHRLRGTV